MIAGLLAVLAACIAAAGSISSALIMRHKPKPTWKRWLERAQQSWRTSTRKR